MFKGIKIGKRTNKVKDFENAKTEEHEIYYSRYIASWYVAGGRFDSLNDILNFKDWMRSINLTEDEVEAIAKIAACGKVELEQSARAFINEMNEEL